MRNTIRMKGWLGWWGAIFVMALALSGNVLLANPALDAKDRCPIASPLAGEAGAGSDRPTSVLPDLRKLDSCRRQDGQVQAGGGCICCYPNRVCACTFVEDCGRTGGVCTGPC